MTAAVYSLDNLKTAGAESTEVGKQIHVMLIFPRGLFLQSPSDTHILWGLKFWDIWHS